MLYKFSFTFIFTFVIASFLSPVAIAQSVAGDNLVIEMNQAFKRGDRKKLSALLPQAKGHALEPYAAYWELKARLQSRHQELEGQLQISSNPPVLTGCALWSLA